MKKTKPVKLCKKVCKSCKDSHCKVNAITTFEEWWKKGVVYCPKATFTKETGSSLQSRKVNIVRKTGTYPKHCPFSLEHTVAS